LKRLATLVLLLAIPFTGCGKSSSKTADKKAAATATTAAARLVKADFIAKADPICARVTSQVNALPEPKSASDLEPLVKKIVDIVKPALADLRALNADPADAAVFKEHFLDPNQAQLDAAERFLADLPAANGDEDKISARAEQWDKETSAIDDASDKHDAALKTFGFNDCAKTNE